FLSLIDLDARPDLQIFYLPARQPAVTHELTDPVIHVAVAWGVGVALIDQGLHHREHAVDVLRGTRLDIRAQHAEARLVLVHGGDHALDQRFERLTVVLGAADDLVVDVGNVAHIGDVIASMAQPARHHVERHHYPRMTDVA